MLSLEWREGWGVRFELRRVGRGWHCMVERVIVVQRENVIMVQRPCGRLGKGTTFNMLKFRPRLVKVDWCAGEGGNDWDARG